MPLLIENKEIVTKPIGLARNEYKDKFAVGNAIRVTLLIPYVQQHWHWKWHGGFVSLLRTYFLCIS